MAVDRRRVLGGALVVGGLLGAACHPGGPGEGAPAVPWPAGDALGIGLENYPYPHPVQYLDVTHIAQADWIDRPAPDWERRARLAYMDVAPEGGPSKGAIVLLHGKNFFGAYWAGVIDALRHAGFRVIVPDLVGWGKSTKPSTLTAAALMAQLSTLADHLQVETFALLGHSTGGLIALHMARALPERVRTLLLENPMGLEDYRHGLIRQVGHDDWAQDERSMTADQIRQYLAHYFVNKAPRLIDPFVAVRTAITRSPEFERWVQSSAAGYDMLLNEPAVDFVASLGTPTLFVCGLADQTYAGAKYTAPQDQSTKGHIAALAQACADRMPKARFVGVPNTGHVPHLESPDAFLSAVLAFLR
ncbi:alpha/beta fold hydrolase [Mycobacterium kubicae]|uniref:alpha/beta fold hydrolase n=1 Tax=Mycobacterium kubicae TaxID=120959 RepID=UPI0016414CA7|nr:alpha/beta hydrolase [Mycobacterium kubicae]QNI06044.1 alpha/beta fold hydrolase [Mycobacterium kubicae]